MATLTQRSFVEIMKKIHSTACPTQDGNKNYFVDRYSERVESAEQVSARVNKK